MKMMENRSVSMSGEKSLVEWTRLYPHVGNPCKRSLDKEQECPCAREHLQVVVRIMREITLIVMEKHNAGVVGLETILTAENIVISDLGASPREENGEPSIHHYYSVVTVKLRVDDSVATTDNDDEKEYNLKIKEDLYLLGPLFQGMLTVNAAKIACSSVPRPLQQLISDLTKGSGSMNEPHKSALEVKDDLDQMMENPSRFLCDQTSLVNFTKELQAPERLHGRDNEISQLLAAHKRVASPISGRSELLLVSGSSGTGKSCLVLEASKRLIERGDLIMSTSNNNIIIMGDQAHQEDDLCDPLPEEPFRLGGGYFVSGKFDQLRGAQPYSAFIRAFTELCHQILALDERRRCIIRSKIKENVGTQGRVLTEVIPNLEQLLDGQDDAIKLGGNEARNRFNFVFRKFARAVAGPEHPLIIFLDDLQWADEASLDLLRTLISDFKNPSILIIGAYRQDEVSQVHPLSMQLREMERRNIPISKISVANMNKEVLNLFVSDLLGLSRRLTWSLTDPLFHQTDGNPFFVVRFLKHLRDGDLLTFNLETLRWEWDEAAIGTAKSANNVVDLLTSKIQKLPSEAQAVLKMAAGIGTYFDDYTLKLIFRSALVDKNILLRSTFSGLSSTLRMASDEGLIKPWGKLGYKFVHDRVQQAVYSLIPEEDRPALHLKIGRLLSRNASRKKSTSNGSKNGRPFTPKKWTLVTSEDIRRFVDRMLFVAVDQLNKGSDSITDMEEKIELAKLNLKAGERAIQSSAFVQAEQYLVSGLKQIEGEKWKTHYELTLQFNSALAEMKYCIGSFDETDVCVTEVVNNATQLLDKLRAYSVRIKSLGAQSKVQEAIDAGFDVLAQLGEPFPKKVNNAMILADLIRTKTMLICRTDDSLRNLPIMKNKLKVAAMQVLCSMLSFTYMCRPEYVSLIAGRLMQLMLRYGACNESAFAVSTYALILGGVLNDYKGGYRFAQLALFLIERFNAREWFAHVYGVVFSCCVHWRQHSQLCIDPLQKAYRVGMSAGDIEYAMWCAYFESKHKFFCGQPLALLEEDMRGYCKLMADQGQETPLASLSTYWQAVLNLLGRSDNALDLTGEAMVQEKVLEEAAKMGNSFLLQCVSLHRLWLAYFLGDYQQASEMADQSRNVQAVSPGVYEVIEHAFYDGLTASALALKHPTEKKWKRIAFKAKARMKRWSESTPENCLHKYLLLRAETASTRGHKVKAEQLYRSAIAAAAKSGYVQDEAMTYERFGEFYIREGDSVKASEYMACAHKLYSTWGAVVKADQLDQRFSSLDEARSRDGFESFLRDRSFVFTDRDADSDDEPSDIFEFADKSSLFSLASL